MRDLPRQQLADRFLFQTLIFRIGKLLKRQLQHFAFRVADDVAHLAIDPQPMPVQCDVCNPDRGLIEGAVKTLLTFAQILERVFPFGDVLAG